MGSELLAAVRARWHNVRYGFLFVPGLVALGFVCLAFLLTWLDELGGAHGLAGFGGDAPTARSILATIATALITVSGLTFSITVVSLQLVSQQFSPRALRNFLGDEVTQIVAGSFVGIFAFCLLVLRSIRQGTDAGGQFVPGLSITAAIALGVLTLGLLLVFIHHMSRSIQLSTIAADIARSTLASLDRLYPDRFGRPAGEPEQELVDGWRSEPPSHRLLAQRAGYVQAIALDELAGAGLAHARVHVPVAPGDFVTPDSPLAEVWVTDGSIEMRAAQRAFVVSNERDVQQDVGYGIRQLADIAIRALSPGVNDPTTARTCIGYLTAIIEQLAQRASPCAVRRFAVEDVVVSTRRRSFTEYLEPLLEVGWHARNDVRVKKVVLEAMASIAEHARRAGAVDRARSLRREEAKLAHGLPG
jgi:uncharacterized membrane protein